MSEKPILITAQPVHGSHAVKPTEFFQLEDDFCEQLASELWGLAQSSIDGLAEYAIARMKSYISRELSSHLFQQRAMIELEHMRAELKRIQATFAEREARLVQTLKDVIDPMGYLKRQADAAGAQLSGMAYSIANDLHFVQNIARQALKETPDAQ